MFDTTVPPKGQAGKYYNNISTQKTKRNIIYINYNKCNIKFGINLYIYSIKYKCLFYYIHYGGVFI